MGTLANIEDPDEMLQNTAIHKGLYSLPRYKAIFLEMKTSEFGYSNL